MSRCLSDVARSIAPSQRSEVSCSRIAPCSRQKHEMNPPQRSPEPRRQQGMDYGETQDVQQVHAAIQREKQEPRVGLEPLSIWLIAVYAVAIFFGGAYLGRFSGNFSGESLDPGSVPEKKVSAAGPGGGQQTAELTPAERGKKIFMANCATC